MKGSNGVGYGSLVTLAKQLTFLKPRIKQQQSLMASDRDTAERAHKAY
jgi:flagellar biosynthesis chaperone FliJ